MAKGYYMINVLLNVEAESIREAYERVNEKMASVDEETFSWESMNEWYGPDGGRIELKEISDTIMSVISERSADDETK